MFFLCNNIQSYISPSLFSSRYRSSRNPDSTERLDIRASNVRMFRQYLLRERRKKLRGEAEFPHLRFSRLSHDRPGCRVGERIYVEGEMVRDIEWKAACDNCFCAMGAIRCVPLACAPPLQGCSPIVREGQCCPSTYNCSEFHANSHSGLSHAHTSHPAVHARIVFSAELIVKFLGQEYCLSFFRPLLNIRERGKKRDTRNTRLLTL